MIIGSQYLPSFITNPILARVLGPTERGRFTFFLSISQWAVTILALGSPQAVTYLVASRRFSRIQSLSVVITVLLTLGIALTILAFGFLFWSPAFTKLTRIELALVATFSFASFSLLMLSSLLLGIQRTTDYYVFQLLTPRRHSAP